MKKIAVVILTKNEEKNIVAVIENVRKITDEIIIIDSGSDDATVGLANLHGARVLYRKWDNDFSAQRNFVLDKTDADYILYIDADERLSFELIESVKMLWINAKPSNIVLCGKLKLLILDIIMEFLHRMK